MKVLLIDDLRNFKPEYMEGFSSGELFTARNSVEGLQVLENNTGHYIAIFLDHDLGFVEGIGVDSIMPVVDYMCKKSHEGEPVKVETVYVHTSNPVGAKNIISALEHYGYVCAKVNASDYFTI